LACHLLHPKHAYIFNSIKDLPAENQITPIVAPLIRAINSIVTDANDCLFTTSLPLQFPECQQQYNDFDCGPFICGFVENIIIGKLDPLFNIDIAKIRQRSNALTPHNRVNRPAKTVKGGVQKPTRLRKSIIPNQLA